MNDLVIMAEMTEENISANPYIFIFRLSFNTTTNHPRGCKASWEDIIKDRKANV